MPIKPTGHNPAPEVGTQLIYQCAKNMKFSHEPNANPAVKIHCLEDGTFTQPQTWPKCVSIESEHLRCLARHLAQLDPCLILHSGVMNGTGEAETNEGTNAQNGTDNGNGAGTCK